MPKAAPTQKPAASETPDDTAFAAEIGKLVRLGRAKRGVTRRQLAADSGLSERYLAQIESGQGNPSAIVLKAIARAFEIPVADLLPRPQARASALAEIEHMLSRVPAADLPGIAALISDKLAAATDRARRISLVGLRGAGKSTLGRKLAEALDVPFLELNRIVEQDYGAAVPLLIEMSGIATFRRYERACLERVIAEHEAAVIATAGGIVANPETYDLVLRRTHAIWIKAPPEEHMARVVAQGDFRPMAQNRAAMADLHAILDARRDDYARAEAQLDTSGETVEQSSARLLPLAEACAGRAPRATRTKK